MLNDITMSGDMPITTEMSHIAPYAPWKFLGVFLFIFFIFCVFLFAIDFVPEKPTIEKEINNEAPTLAAATVVPQYLIEMPIRVVVPKIGIDINIENPPSADLPTLNAAVNKGAVHYPGSALLGENAAMFLFAHQSYLPALKNPAFKAFNGLENLTSGDEINVFSENAIYVYKVDSVELKRADEAQISLERGSRILTLSTCNSVGAKEERYVVTATLVFRTLITQNS